ncbi:MFS transporter [uncultured Friedmanniella sp.]|uniref:MFS transporter n=1 Tax=uncultured Friedmanniella sp. TaxID=335381 RepID=UPI0035CB486D
MSGAAQAVEERPAGGWQTRKVAVSSGVGATIEAYDFIGYGTAAALYFSTYFFPASDPLTGTLLSFATLGVGFAVRPLGGVVGGYLGDRVGRKPVLVASLIVMGLATFCIGLLPTYQTVGIWAGILLVFVRVVQGLAYGAEWGGAILMTYEHAPRRSKGKYTGMVQAGFPVGLLLANLVFLFSVHLPGTWAWRLPFLASGLLVIVGVVIRTKVPESPVFEGVRDRGEIVKNPIAEVIRQDWRNILRALGLRIAETAGYAVAITFMLSYLKSEKLADKTLTLTALCIASAIGILATYNWGRLTDRIGRRPVYLLGTGIMVVFAFPMFLLVNTGSAVLIVIAVVIAYAVCQNSLAGAQGPWFPELFVANTRASGASLAYQFAAVVSGFTPFVVTLLYSAYGWSGAATLFGIYGAIGLVAALVTRETFGPAERKAAQQTDQPVRTAVSH